ncbi:hypothetical protein GCM10023085_11490 [Actinomadura viridis]|uniref:Uncharacterized protein n=1 Tax=Actinomadura viridis TaxID=58110 RepID=A0A931DTZ9_9ACTN|nr:hypothetical protein [Actinomadura viridis]MBG6093525.1 hypothetical protein [Actinomadura viridis]
MPPEVDVKRDALLVQASVWIEQREVLGQIASATKSLTVGEAGGAFEKAVALYNKRTEEIGFWTWEGSSVLLKVAHALTEASKKYGATEQEISAATQGVIKR